jgi:hypothetical protein
MSTPGGTPETIAEALGRLYGLLRDRMLSDHPRRTPESYRQEGELNGLNMAIAILEGTFDEEYGDERA